MKILFMISSLNTGGAEKILSTIANHFDSRGDTITVLTVSDEKPFFTLNESIKLRQLGLSQPKRGLINRINHIPKLINSLKNNILEVNPDVVISFMSEMNILSIIATKLAQKPIIISERSAYDFLDIKPFWKRVRRVLYPFTDALVVLTHADKKRYHFVKNVYTIENPLVLKQYHSNIEREKIILGVGRLNTVKGFDMLIKAFHQIENKEWKLVIVGEGGERKNLELLIDELNLTKRVELVGMTQDVEYYYKKASIFVLSSRTEGFPGVLCEAMGYGCAVLSFDCPSAPSEIISSEVDGILVEAENIDSLSNEIEKLVSSSTKREALGNNAKKIVNKLSIDKVTKKWLEVIENRLKEK